MPHLRQAFSVPSRPNYGERSILPGRDTTTAPMTPGSCLRPDYELLMFFNTPRVIPHEWDDRRPSRVRCVQTRIRSDLLNNILKRRSGPHELYLDHRPEARDREIDPRAFLADS